ncbi:hypothetical protein F2Q70_00039495 [Brassica cretica]|uniref:Uncharacterized protein n=1 Tax=Brassica cretica TaxID=69181 RepID=A0A8S9K140_BRACR|nr:hypothetical protein F2Q70_00039495 [Brassica cretica]
MAPTSESHKASAFTATLKRVVEATVSAKPLLGSEEHNERDSYCSDETSVINPFQDARKEHRQDEIVKEINEPNSRWKAVFSDRFANTTRVAPSTVFSGTQMLFLNQSIRIEMGVAEMHSVEFYFVQDLSRYLKPQLLDGFKTVAQTKGICLLCYYAIMSIINKLYNHIVSFSLLADEGAYSPFIRRELRKSELCVVILRLWNYVHLPNFPLLVPRPSFLQDVTLLFIPELPRLLIFRSYENGHVLLIDEGALKYLNDIKLNSVAVSKEFKLHFFFAQNLYLKNTVVNKTNHMIEEDESILEKAIGTEIELFPIKCLDQKDLDVDMDGKAFPKSNFTKGKWSTTMISGEAVAANDLEMDEVQ